MSDDRIRALSALFAANAALLFTGAAAAASGPGLGSHGYTQAELFQPVVFFDTALGADGGTNVALLVNGYLLLHVAPDSGKPGKSLAIYDVSDPRAPKLVKTVADEHTALLRETHSLPIARIAGREYVAFQSTTGIQIWDFTDPLLPAFSSKLDLEGILEGDYFNAAWMTSWQGRWLFVAGTNQGVYVVDAVDPAAPALVKRIGNAETGGFLVGPIFAMGDRLVVTSMNLLFPQFSLLDITSPADLFMVNTLSGPGGQLYSSAVLGKRIYGIGRNQHFTIISTEDDSLEVVADVPGMGPGSYANVQDNFVHYGGKESYQKVDVSDEANPKVVGTIVLERPDTDHGQALAFGNLVYIGNDHGTGSAFAVHQMEADTTPPAVVEFFPGDESLDVAVTSRIGISFSDNLDFASVDPASIEITRIDGGPIDGIYSYWANTVSFSPTEPLLDDAGYQVVVKAGGVRDVSGNAVADESVFVFSTGATPPGPAPSEPETGAESSDEGCACGVARAERGFGWLGLIGVLSAAAGSLRARRRRG